jgi:hypothetical protein
MRKTYTKNLEKTMDVMERSQTFLTKANKFWHMPFTFLLDHLNGKTILKKLGSQGVLTNEEYKALMVGFWVCKNAGFQLPCNNSN